MAALGRVHWEHGALWTRKGDGAAASVKCGEVQPGIVRTSLVTTGLGFYNPHNTAPETAQSFFCARGMQRLQMTAVRTASKSLVFHSIFCISQEH